MASRDRILIRQTSMGALLLVGNRNMILSSKCLLLWYRHGLEIMARTWTSVVREKIQEHLTINCRGWVVRAPERCAARPEQLPLM